MPLLMGLAERFQNGSLWCAVSEREELPSIEKLGIAKVFEGIPAPPPLFTDGKPKIRGGTHSFAAGGNSGLSAGDSGIITAPLAKRDPARIIRRLSRNWAGQMTAQVL
jgi:hypothetical protein